MTVELALPRSASTRDMVDIVLEAQHIPGDLTGQIVVVDGSHVQDSSSSFADEFVRKLASRHPRSIRLVHLPPILDSNMRRAAKLRKFKGIRQTKKHGEQ